MKRKYSVSEFSEFVRTARAKVPGICIGTDVIVGFPGETDGYFRHDRKSSARTADRLFSMSLVTRRAIWPKAARWTIQYLPLSSAAAAKFSVT